MPAKLPGALAIMADVARNPAFAADELERARKEALDGLEVAYGEPGQVAGFANAPVVYAGTPFAHAADGTPASLKRLTRDDLVRFHDRYWRPDNAILVLTGDITPDEGFALAAKAFGDWPKPAEPPPPPRSGQANAAPRNVVIDLPGTGQAAVSLTKPAIARSDPRYYQGAGRQCGAGRRLFGPAQRGDPGQARPLLRRRLLDDRAAHAGRLHRPGADQERGGAAGGRPDP